MPEDLTPEEMEELNKYLSGSAPIADEKHNVHTFISKVFQAKDTTKVGNLTEPEIGMMRNPVRAYKEEEIWSRNIIGCEPLANMFAQMSEIATSTSLSRQATLLRFATTTTRQMGDITKPKVENKGWFTSKKKEVEGGNVA